MRISGIGVALLALIAPAALAQTGNPAGMAPDTHQAVPGVPKANEANTPDKLFVMLVAAGGLAEVDLAHLAAPRAQSEAIKAFGQQMIRDHTNANQRLSVLAKAADIPFPETLDPEHAEIHAKLANLRGPQFDLEYAQGQVQDHIKTVQLLEWEIGSGEDKNLQRFAEETLPIVFQHLSTAQGLLVDARAQLAH